VTVEQARRHDVALLKVTGKNADGSGLAHLELDDDGSANPGDQVLLIGFPGGQKKCEIRTVLRVNGYGISYKGIAIGGFSGGPMISMKSGKVVGFVDARGISEFSRNTPTDESYGIDVAAIRELLKVNQH